MKICNMRVQNLYQPIGIDTENPSLSWKLKSDKINEWQTSYRIVVAASEGDVRAGKYTLWDSGKVEDSACTGIRYAGKKLQSGQIAYWKVKVWDREGHESGWSNISFWEMGLLYPSDWKASWITAGEDSVIDKLLRGGKNENGGSILDYGERNVIVGCAFCAPILSKEFVTGTDKKVERARLYISGLGLYEAYINGKVLGEGTYFNPAESDVRDTIYYATYDITEYLHTDAAVNAVSFLLGNGQYANYRIHRQHGRYYKTDDARSEAEVSGMFGEVKGIAQIVITYKDGSQDVIGTDGTWSFVESPITENSWYGGEDYDARLEIEGWNDISPAIPRKEWGRAAVVKENIPTGTLKAREFLPIAISKNDTISSEQITVEEKIFESPDSDSSKGKAGMYKRNGYRTYLVDMGRNGAGFPEMTIDTNIAGQMVRMYPAEVPDFTGADGHINQASCTQSESDRGNFIYDTYITNASGRQTYHPRMCYHGYRYLEVTVPGAITLSPANFKGYILRTENEKTGFFVCSDETLNQINTLTERSIESNMYSTFTDCPQIEKLGWLETPGLMFYSMSQTYDISAWIPKLVRDMEDAQYDSGRIAAIAPEYFKIGALYKDVNWNGSIIATVWQYYEVYKDSAIFSERTYRAMKAYMSYLENDVAADYMITEGQMGEWGEMTQYGTTPVVLVETTAYYSLAVTMAKIADAIGKSEDKNHFRDLAEKIKIAFHKDKICYNPMHLYGNGTQSGYGCVLFSGICLKENQNRAMELLIESIKKTDYHLTSGEVGLKQVFTALADHGRSDVVYNMVRNDSMPSYKYFVDKGLTTLPEYWNFEDLWGTVARSRNHAMMGHVKEWFTRYLAGIQPISAGYDKVAVRPALVDGITFARAQVDTIHGSFGVEWNREGNQGFQLKVDIPVGTEAVVYVPALAETALLACNGERAECHRSSDGMYVIMEAELGSGFYEISESVTTLNEYYIGKTYQ